jgi:hypothetical protein
MLIAGLIGLALAGAGVIAGAAATWMFAREQAVNELSRIRARAYHDARRWRAETERAVSRSCSCQHPHSQPPPR